MLLKDSKYTAHQTGDIIIINNPGPARPSIITTQEIITGKEANSTHIFLCYAPSIFIEATAFKKVALFMYTDDGRSSTEAECVKILRHKKVSQSEMLQLKIMEASKYHLYKEYNLRDLFINLLSGSLNVVNQKLNIDNIHIPTSESIDKPRIFCSELIGTVYRTINDELNCDMFNIASTDLYPNMFEYLDVMDDSWEDISDRYFPEDWVTQPPSHIDTHLTERTIRMVQDSVKYNGKETAYFDQNMNIWFDLIDNVNSKIEGIFDNHEMKPISYEIEQFIKSIDQLIKMPHNLDLQLEDDTVDSVQLMHTKKLDYTRNIIMNYMDGSIDISNQIISTHNNAQQLNIEIKENAFYYNDVMRICKKTKKTLPVESFLVYSDYINQLNQDVVKDNALYRLLCTFVKKLIEVECLNLE